MKTISLATLILGASAVHHQATSLKKTSDSARIEPLSTDQSVFSPLDVDDSREFPFLSLSDPRFLQTRVRRLFIIDLTCSGCYVCSSPCSGAVCCHGAFPQCCTDGAYCYCCGD
ncbi:hypothetical protein P168DRAFT_63908 [Aspergillus campestris IBT 28561]|uniref:Uncharacterized protein n=1 Tax=Aspergillus campestris (strain IBT 28561) TaxID=1392248 RepID=A0A2I1CSY7_ASPC2|nr:uncharacterized protein P168DRAFT_63908 [Aspergillus campestris IBT 28561]PKY00742.1 hypothetical protein P168DRAFT_63908 [Aspergillus campestris IBT 28561]